MTVQASTHINFRGNARAALEFYQSVFGGDLMIVTYGDAGGPGDPKETSQVMWGQVSAPTGFRVMAYDVPSTTPWEPGVNAFFVSVRSDSPGELAAFWAKLCEGAHVLAALAPAAWAPLYGMLKDRFGVTWVMDVANVSAAEAP